MVVRLCYTFVLILFALVLGYDSLLAQEFVSPVGASDALKVDKDPAKYYLLKPGSEQVFKITGPIAIKIYGRILNPIKAGNASLMINQGNTLIGAMLITPTPSSDLLLLKGRLPLSQVVIQEFNVSEGEQRIRIKSSLKSPDVIIAVEVMSKKMADQSIELIPLVPLAPLVPPKKEETPQEIDLVPLVPLVPTDTKSVKKEEKQPPPTEKKEVGYREIVARSETTPTKRTEANITTIVETTKKTEIGERRFTSAANIGIIQPMQSIGGPYLNIDLLLCYYPIKSSRAFGIGIETGFHNLNVDLKDGSGNLMYSMRANVIPLSLFLSYSIPISPKIIADLLTGGGTSFVSADLSGKGGRSSHKDSAVSFLLNIGGAISYRIDRNNSLGIRVGFMSGRASTDFVSNLDIGGLATFATYGFTF